MITKDLVIKELCIIYIRKCLFFPSDYEALKLCFFKIIIVYLSYSRKNRYPVCMVRQAIL